MCPKPHLRKWRLDRRQCESSKVVQTGESVVEEPAGFEVDFETVWLIDTRDLPPLEKAMRAILAALDQPG